MGSHQSPKFTCAYWLRLGVFTGILIAIPLFIMGFYLVQRQIDILVIPTRQLPARTPVDFNLPFKNVTLTAGDGLKLAAWYIPGSQPNAIILVHGLNTNREVMLPTAALLAEAGYPLLLLDMRSHGESEGNLISYGYREAFDVQAGVDYLAILPNVDRIGAIGSSLGGAAVARAAAADSRLEAVVIQSSYSSLPNAVNDAFDDLTIFPKWPFAPLIVALAERRVGIKIGQVDSARDLGTMAPRAVMIIHSRDDKLFPLSHAQKMYDAAQAPKNLWIIENLGHDDPAVVYDEEYQKRVITFFEEAFAR